MGVFYRQEGPRILARVCNPSALVRSSIVDELRGIEWVATGGLIRDRLGQTDTESLLRLPLDMGGSAQ